MKIKQALKPTKKAVVDSEGEPLGYAKQDNIGVLYWHDKETDEQIGPVSLRAIRRNHWKPYHEVKEIRPEKGEVWQYACNSYPHYITESDGELYLNWVTGSTSLVRTSDNPVIHNKNGWKRICPEVKEVWGKSQIQKEEFKKNQVYANEMLRQALELTKEMGENVPFASISEQLAASALKGVLIEKKSSVEKVEIDRVEWIEDDGIVYPKGGFADWKSLPGRLPMKMVLFLQKEEHEPQG